jgi:hypothetical protein
MPDSQFYKIGEDGHVVSLGTERTFEDYATAIGESDQHVRWAIAASASVAVGHVSDGCC